MKGGDLMKCQNCGAELEEKRSAKFCPYCGHEVEASPKTPETIPGAIYGVAKGVIDEVGRQLDYRHEHAEEIEERKKKRERENLKQGLWILLVAVLLFASLMAYISHQADKEKAEKNASPSGVICMQHCVA